MILTESCALFELLFGARLVHYLVSCDVECRVCYYYTADPVGAVHCRVVPVADVVLFVVN